MRMKRCAALLLAILLLPLWLLFGALGEEGGGNVTGMGEHAAAPDGIYRIVNKATGRYLNMTLAGMVDRALVRQYGKTDMQDEMWRITKTDKGYTIVNAFVPRYLAVREANYPKNATIHVTTEAEGEQYLWQLVEVDGYYRLQAAAGPEGLGLGLPVNEIASKYLPLLREYEGDDTSLWALEPVAVQDVLPTMLPLTGDVFHASCPQIIKEGDTYYMIIMAPHILIKYSKDLVHWETVGTVFGERDPSWLAREVPGYGIWAPSAYKIGDKYFIYYCISTLGKQNSAIGVAVNATMDPSSPDYRWEDGGMVIRSFTGSRYNCIDPNIITDEEGRVWLNFGSYWGGLYQREINPETGNLMYPNDGTAEEYHLARRTVNYGAVEAPYMIKRGEYYYLFVAFNPMNLTYHNRVGRSTSIHGPFVDRDGVEMTAGGGNVVTEGMYDIQMPGHASVFLDDDGQYYFVGEYFREGSPSIMMISTILWDEDGWPLTALTPDIRSRLPAEK